VSWFSSIRDLRTKRRSPWLASSKRALVATLGSALVVMATSHAAADVAVVVNPEVPVDELSFADLRKIMLGDRLFWSSGNKVTIVVTQPDDPGRTILLERVYKMSEERFRQYWIAKVFRGEAAEGPKIVLSSEGAIELVGVLDGAIAFVDSDDVPSGLKVLRIDGLKPGDSGYALGSKP